MPETQTTPLEWLRVPCLKDNYAWIVRASGPAGDRVAIVDVPEAAPVLAALTERGWSATDIFLTHHHPDHIGGVAELVAATGAKVWGAKDDAARLPPLDETLRPGDTFLFGGTPVEVLDVPGHTIGHIAYHLPKAQMLFSGDSLMSWGCGRLFEGTPAQMFDSLTRLAALPDATLVFSGHEYTEANGRFALSLEPEHPALLTRMTDVAALRAEGKATVPVRLGLERTTNPFLRGTDPALALALGLNAQATPLAVFTEARARKDRF